ncbi:very short patch repair endonuclease [Profundibacterium mesophilum]|uniref:very short patch repair endonuclease n=1 Tax=Profundibacterium mesophilum TaxID=1258573 RepID=UPI0022A6C224|nr:DNA mismatch endonuclease Vsr [Profundibacterium mesophilum]
MSKQKHPLTRSENMSRIRSVDTKPEVWVRRELHARGFRFRIHRRDLPGRPDILLPKYSAAIQIHGCYWHGHSCIKRWPRTRTEYWVDKIGRNISRDDKNLGALIEKNFRVLVVWECALGRSGQATSDVVDSVVAWLHGDGVVGTVDTNGLHQSFLR